MINLTAPNAAGNYPVSIQLSGPPNPKLQTFGATAVGTIAVTCEDPSPVLKSLKVTPDSPSTAAGTTVQFSAEGTFSDGSTQDLTSTVTWAATGTAATISNTAGSQGLATGVNPGTSDITARSGSITSPADTLTVTPAVLTSLNVTPANPTIPVGTTVQFSAVGTFSDGSTQDLTSTVTWAATGTAATISNDAGSQGLAIGVNAGTSDITATSGSITSAPVTLTVTSSSCTLDSSSGFSCSATAEGASCFVEVLGGGATWLLKDLTTDSPLTGGLTPVMESVSVNPGDTIELIAGSPGSLDCT
jgi:hypothetical protein